MNDAIAVARIFAAVGVSGLRVAAAARILRAHRPRRHCKNVVDESLRAMAGSLGLWRDGVQTAVRLFRNRRVRKLLLDLLVHGGGFLWIGLAKDVAQLQKRQGSRDEDGMSVR